MKQESVNPELFRWNRKRFAREMLADSVAVFCSNDLVASNGETYCRFRQNPDLYYLSGITQPETMLVLAPKTAKQGFEEVLFIRRPDQRAGANRGPGLDLQQAAQLSGIEQVCFLDELESTLHELILLTSRVYINSREDRHAYSEAPARDLRFAERLMKLYPAHKYHRAQPILKKIGMVKSAPEVGLISKAIVLADQGMQAAVQQLKAGVAEHVVEAAAVHAIIAGGAQGLSHPVRVASGKRSLYPSYDANSAKLHKGQLVQLHVGVAYAGYHATVARAYSVGGKFTARQGEVYQSVLQILQEGSRMLVPGKTLPDCEDALKSMLYEACDALHLNSVQLGREFASSNYHHVGRTLRDPYLPYTPLQSGMVIACEPAIYLVDEGFGIQLRDVILVTDEGPINLSAQIATNLDAVQTPESIPV